ncbi:hypothetical protein CCR90_08745 [Rhodovulum sulfidophilum]|uniref:hypothetical protein n=1 Tax=Rhodovulum sulfidophilum TaxID=35806 RepID=UPI0019119D22|nr:hypothetical protein [Rhodovulum sulfidophilum]MBK5923865.1 hypothetical protein [Rhodovulum sulfidophilum]
MPDDQNDKLMEQFIQQATPKRLEAMQEGLAKQIEDQIGGLKANAEKMLDEIKDARRERETREKQQAEEMGQLKTLLERGDTQGYSPAPFARADPPDAHTGPQRRSLPQGKGTG